VSYANKSTFPVQKMGKSVRNIVIPATKGSRGIQSPEKKCAKMAVCMAEKGRRNTVFGAGALENRLLRPYAQSDGQKFASRNQPGPRTAAAMPCEKL
jgi:hypothetical protein